MASVTLRCSKFFLRFPFVTIVYRNVWVPPWTGYTIHHPGHWHSVEEKHKHKSAREATRHALSTKLPVDDPDNLLQYAHKEYE